MKDIQELRRQPHLHPLPLHVLPEDTVNATLKDGPVKTGVGKTQAFFHANLRLILATGMIKKYICVWISLTL